MAEGTQAALSAASRSWPTIHRETSIPEPLNDALVARHMGAELMSFTLLSDLPLRESSYQPRHSSSRWAAAGSGRLARAMHIAVSRSRAGRPEPQQLSARFLAISRDAASSCPFLEASTAHGPPRCPCPCGRAVPGPCLR